MIGGLCLCYAAVIPIEGGVWGLWFSLAWKEKKEEGDDMIPIDER